MQLTSIERKRSQKMPVQRPCRCVFVQCCVGCVYSVGPFSCVFGGMAYHGVVLFALCVGMLHGVCSLVVSGVLRELLFRAFVLVQVWVKEREFQDLYFVHRSWCFGGGEGGRWGGGCCGA